MALKCEESHQEILTSEGLFAGTRADSKHFFPLNGELVRRIPVKKRRNQPCGPDERGIDIHHATAATEGGVFKHRGLSIGTFAFSIPAKVAWAFLPNSAGRFPNGKKR